MGMKLSRRSVDITKDGEVGKDVPAEKLTPIDDADEVQAVATKVANGHAEPEKVGFFRTIFEEVRTNL